MSISTFAQEDCVFCKIVSGEVHSFKVWESEDHLAFLSIYPNTRGVTVVIPKVHFDSYIFHMQNQDYASLLAAAKQVGLLLDEKLEVGRTAMITEGFGVNHVHVKLFPLHGTKKDSHWIPVHSPDEMKEIIFDEYQGYVSSHDASRAPNSDLEEIMKLITSTK